MYVDRKARVSFGALMFKFLLGSEPIFLLVRRASPQIRTKRPLYFDLVGLGDLAGVAADGTLSFSSAIMTTDVKGLAHFDKANVPFSWAFATRLPLELSCSTSSQG